MSTTYRATDLVSSTSSLYDHAIAFKSVVSSRPATQAARFWSQGVYQAGPAVTMNAPEALLPRIGALGWTATEALETRMRLSSFAEDWEAPGMEAYDDL
ncbi:MAG: hypothetical protein EOM24_28380 [Chloroflexia bacterium]|nr:hypothetical protein [Chloroflexia bacterium]